jgi:hypothetical protein
MIGTANRSSIALCLELGSSAPCATGGSGRKRKPGRTEVATGSCKRTIGLVLSGSTITTHTIDGGTWCGCFMGTGNACSMTGTRNGGHVILCLVRRSSTSRATGGGGVKRKPGRTKLTTFTAKGRQCLVLPVGAIGTGTIRSGGWSTAIRPRPARRIRRTRDGCYGIVGLILPIGAIFTGYCR